MLKTLRLAFMLVMLCGVLQVALAQPENDSCHAAIAVMLDETVDFSTLDATTGGAFFPDAPCAAGDDTLANDIWYTYTAGFTGEVEWSVCGTADFDTKIAVYQPGTACPPTFEDLLDCNEDGASCSGFTSEITFDVEEGMTYLLQLGGFDPTDTTGERGSGTFIITEFVFTGPANSFCEEAIPVELGTHEFTTIDAITDGPDHLESPCFSFGLTTATNDIWYTYTAGFTGSVHWSTCDLATFDTRLAVYTPGSPCPPLDGDLYACNDDGGGCPGFTSDLIFDVEEGLTYLLRLGGFSASGTGEFLLEEIIPPDPPQNDFCENADEIFIISREEADNFDIIFEGTTEFGTFDLATFIFPSCLGNTNGGEFSDVWFKFNTFGNTELELRTNAVDLDAFFYADFFPNCGLVEDSTFINAACIELTDGVNFDSDTISGLPEEDIELFVRVTTRLTSDTPGAFWIQVIGDIVSNVKNTLELEAFNFFPNPANTEARVQFGLTEATNIEVEIVNALGQVVQREHRGKFMSGQQELRLNLQGLQSGIYFLRLNGNNKQHTSRFLKL